MVQLPLRAPARKEVSREAELLVLELVVIWLESSDLVYIQFWFSFISLCKFLNRIRRSKWWVDVEYAPHSTQH